MTIVRIPPPAGRGGGASLLKGLLYFFHRDKPGTFPIETPSAYAVIIGTEFSLEVADNGAITLHLIDGQEVEMTNSFGRVELASGESALAEPGQSPRPTAALQAVNVIQWALYYPGVLDLDELRLAATEREAELEFSFGHVDFAREAIEKAVAVAPRNAQAWAVKGFLSAAENRIREAIGYFDQAIALDGARGNAWLGRGIQTAPRLMRAGAPHSSQYPSRNPSPL